MTFADLGLSDELLRAVSDSGYDEPTPIQRAAIPSVLMGKDLIGIAQTGTGKTAGFVLPMIDILHEGRSRARMPRSLILEPTRELAMQVAENFEKYGKYHPLSMALLMGGVQMGDQVKALEKGVDVLIATPGRLMDLFGRGKIMLNDCNLLVIDEADRMLDMGFIPDIEEICSKLPKIAPDPAVLGDHAAADPEARGEVPQRSQAGRGRPSGDRQHQYRAAAGRGPRRQEEGRACATSCATRSSRTRSSSATARRRFASSPAASSAPASRSARSRATWTSPTASPSSTGSRRTRSTILVASDVAARGLDVKGVSHVINFDVPWQPDDYIHRIGRTGRAGHEGHRDHARDPRGCRSDRPDREADRPQDSARAGELRPSEPTEGQEPPSQAAKPSQARSRRKPRPPAQEPSAAPAADSRAQAGNRAERSTVVEDIKRDWNGPLPGFLSVSAG